MSHRLRGWAKAKPRTMGERRALKKRCGAAAFLDPSHLKYPIVAARSSSCRPDCRGLRAAFSRASSRHRRKLVAKVDRLARRAGCSFERTP